LASRPSAADAAAEAAASFERAEPPGRARNQVSPAAAASATIAQALKISAASWAGSSPRSEPFRRWKSDQSRQQA